MQEVLHARRISACFHPFSCCHLIIKFPILSALVQELDVLLEEAAKSGVQPVIGLRAKLATRHGGHWGTTSGENAKFGLSPRDIVAVVRKLAAMGMADCLQLLHFHIGSQVGLYRWDILVASVLATELLLLVGAVHPAYASIRCRDTDMTCRRIGDYQYKSKHYRHAF